MPQLPRLVLLLGACMWLCGARAQVEEDTITNVYQLGELVIRGHAQGLDVEGFVRQVMEDTTFQQAFLNTKYHPHRVKSELRVRNKGERETAYLYRSGRLVRNGALATLALDSTAEHGKLRSKDGSMRYLTAEMYDDVFFPKGTWTANARLGPKEQAIQRGSKFEKYKSELKKFMFNPGQEIASVPMIGDKLALFDPKMLPLYDYTIDSGTRGEHPCWVFSAVAKDTVRGKPADEDDTVIKQMTTWFDQSTMQVIAREYRIAHASLLLDFDITIKVDNSLLNGALLPVLVQYEGDWDIPFKKREIVRFYLLMDQWQVVP
ncbi:MAG: hypothetical protein QM724_11660 [Flavobacteriales bacterium]